MDDQLEGSTLGSFLLPSGFQRPAVRAVLREGSVLAELGRFALASRTERRSYRGASYLERSAVRQGPRG
jgi:triacylglycerol lipase